jgi:hypothetical protein
MRRIGWFSLAVMLLGCGGSDDAAPTADGGDDSSAPSETGTTDDTGTTSSETGTETGSASCDPSVTLLPDWVRNAKPKSDVWIGPAGNDANDGSEAKPLKMTAAAIAKWAPGVRLSFKEGTYACAPVANLAGTSDAPAILRSADGPRKAKFDCAGGSFGFSHANFVVIDGVEISNAGGHGVQLDSGSPFDVAKLSGDFVLMNSYVHDTKLAGIKVSQARNLYVFDNEFAHWGAGRQAVEMVAVDMPVIVGNEGHHGDSFDEVKGGAHGGVIAKNYVHDLNPGSQGILVGGDGTGQQYLIDSTVDFEAKDLKVFSNVVVGSDTAAFRIVGCHDCVVANNTYVGTTAKAILRVIRDCLLDTSGGCGLQLHNSNVRVANNVFTWTSGGTYVIASDDMASNVKLDHNAWFTSGADVTALGSDFPFEGEASSLYVDPKVGMDFHLASGSPALGKGTPIADVTGTFEGKCPPSPPYLGAF